MRVRASTLRRAGLCLILGVLTSWLVAWGLVIAAWRGEWRLPQTTWEVRVAVAEPHLLKLEAGMRPGWTVEEWWVVRVDNPTDTDAGYWARMHRDFGAGAVLEYERDYATRRRMPTRPLDPELYRRSPAAAVVGEAPGGVVRVHGIGWPKATVNEVREMTPVGRDFTWLPDSMGWDAPWLTGNDPVLPWSRGLVTPISLPYRPDWPGLAVNTAFYGGVWMLPLFGLPALRRTLRARRGRCTRCNYDLAGTPAGPCPECGTARGAVSPPARGASGAIG